ncbi:CoA-binding protein [Actinomadura parmotrematis]|uniref:CoA-binding protein n=1 Tax=Actinomadura parmotrematis TaxID=2864039 RepID=A0ABS7FW59_9ACTN|nr:CoA-binding protein [Actinomadura parmotrematis]MBW8484670.1 CoA-binding protein [Actinomadura parmotrematis]
MADNEIDRMLDARVWAFVGLSGDRTREVYRQASLMQQRGKKIVPVHPDGGEVLGEKVYASLADVPDAIDVVGVYRRSEFAGAVVDEAVAAGAKGVWLPLNVIDDSAARRARDAGLDVVMDHCPAVEWAARR